MSYSFEKDSLVYGGKKFPPNARTFGQMRPVLAAPDAPCKLSEDTPTYFMYREVKRFGHVRYDLTRMIAADLCGERNKTYGHIHPKSASGFSFPEVYEVLEGNVHFLLQKVTQLGVQDVVLLSAKKGDCFMVPPDFGHVTINAGKGELVMANLVSDGFESEYSSFTMRRGACVYEKADGKLVKNPNYGTDFEVRKLDAVKYSETFACFAPFKKKSLLEAAENRKNIEFLEKPELFY